MGRISANASRSFVLAGVSATLAIGLVAMVPAASGAAQRDPAPRALEGRIAMAAARDTSAAQLATSTHAGLITGVVRTVAGTPFAGACVSAAGPDGHASAVTRADGTYLLAGLHPGRYALRVVPCAASRRASDARPVVSLWPGLPATIAVRAGQMATLPPARVGQHSPLRLAPVPASAGARSPTGSISGLVTGGGRPLRGICAEAYPVNGGLVGAATTSKAGRYRISGLRPGRYQVEFADSLCQTGGVNWLSQWYPGINSPFLGSGTRLHVLAGKEITRIDGRLKLGGELAGTVRSKSGKKLSGICVDVNGTLPKLNGFIGFQFGTNKDGFFALHALFPGRYTIEFRIGCGTKGNYAFQWWKGAAGQSRATEIHIAGHQIVRNIDPVLVRGAAITGVVKGRSAAGPPLSGVCVSAFGTDDNQDAFAISGRGGSYRLEGLASGRYLIAFDPTCGNGPSPINYVGLTRSITLKAGMIVSRFNAYLPQGADLSGKVTDPHGRALGSVCVQVNDPRGDFTMTDRHGSYSIVGIQPGSYAVGFFGGCGNTGSLAPQFYNDQPNPFAANLVSFKAGKTTANIDAVMTPGGTIVGVVTDAIGHRLDGSCVGAATEGQFGLGQAFADIEFTAGGRYLMKNLAPGPYLIEFNCGGDPRYAVQWFNAQPDSSTAELLSVNPGATTTASARLGPAGSIAGTVTDTAGHRLGGICVGVDNPANLTPISLPDGPNGQSVTTRGHYRIGGLAPGRYLLQFSDCVIKPRYASQWYRNKTTEVSASPVTVRARRTVSGVNAALTVGGSISGEVTGPSGQPLRGVCVEDYDAAGQIFGFAQTDRAGRYALTGLASGRYALFFGFCMPGGPNLASVNRPGLVTMVAPKAVTGINIKLEPGSSVSGRVTGAAPMSPQRGVCVLLLPVNPDGAPGSAYTGSNGRYVASGLAAGKYQAVFNDPLCFFADGLAPQWYNGQPTQATATDITVTPSHTTTGIGAALRSYGGITGTVSNGAHAGVRGECVTAVPAAQTIDPLSGGPPSSEVAVSSRTGHYALADLLAGRYKIEFSVGCGDSGFATQWWNDANSAKSATVITVGFTVIGGINASLRG